MFNKGQLAGLMKQAQAMQENIKKTQDELSSLEVIGEAGSGVVKVTMTCKHHIQSVRLGDGAMAEDKEMLEALLLVALHDAEKKANAMAEEKMARHSAGMPAGMKLPF